MGYTHYWRQKQAFSQDQWSDLCKVARAIIEATPATIRGPLGTGDHIIDDGQIMFNGCDLDGSSHETFMITREVRAPHDYEKGEDHSSGMFDFCKTACKPYDDAVVAILLYIHGKSGDEILDISSDGDILMLGADGTEANKLLAGVLQERAS